MSHIYRNEKINPSCCTHSWPGWRLTLTRQPSDHVFEMCFRWFAELICWSLNGLATFHIFPRTKPYYMLFLCRSKTPCVEKVEFFNVQEVDRLLLSSFLSGRPQRACQSAVTKLCVCVSMFRKRGGAWLMGRKALLGSTWFVPVWGHLYRASSQFAALAIAQGHNSESHSKVL